MVQSERHKAIIKEVQEESTPVIQLSNKLIEAALMYYAGQRVEELGMQADLAANDNKVALNEALLKVSGTVPEKKARAEKITEDKALVAAIYKRAYNTLKVKLEMAEKIYSGLKKSLSKRIAEVDLDRFSKDKYVRERAEDDE